MRRTWRVFGDPHFTLQRPFQNSSTDNQGARLLRIVELTAILASVAIAEDLVFWKSGFYLHLFRTYKRKGRNNSWNRMSKVK